MMDQAYRLRQIIEGLKLKQSLNQANIPAPPKPRNAKVITITSGKGGVGKTNITINLAIALSKMGLKVIIIDADLGLANIDVLFGIVSKHSLVDVIQDKKSIFEILSDGPEDIKFISGGSGVEELVKLDKAQLDNFIENIALLDKYFDIILIDTGAGLSDCVMSFIMAADEVLVVVTPEPTSITDAYALIKMVANRDREKIIKIIINRAEDLNEADQILNKLSLVAEKFLSIKLQSLGYIFRDEAVIKAVKQQQPFSMSFPKSQASKQIKDISRNLIETGEETNNDQVTGTRRFVNRLVSFWHG